MQVPPWPPGRREARRRGTQVAGAGTAVLALPAGPSGRRCVGAPGRLWYSHAMPASRSRRPCAKAYAGRFMPCSPGPLRREPR